MYLTAHRVRSPQGKEGINAALYLHKGVDVPEGTWNSPDVTFIANELPGRRVAESIDVAPGGNSVQWFLDVASPDDTPQSTVVAALDCAEAVVGSRNPLSLIHENVAVYFSLNIGEEGTAQTAFQQLRERVLVLLTNPPVAPWLAKEPLSILATRKDDKWIFTLSSNDAQRIRDEVEAETGIARVTVPDDVATDFRAVHGELYSFVPEWVTNLDKDTLLRLGGVRIVHQGKIVWEWPRR